MASKRTFIGVFVAAGSMSLIPIWTVDVLPMGDLGGHIELMDIIVRHAPDDAEDLRSPVDPAPIL